MVKSEPKKTKALSWSKSNHLDVFGYKNVHMLPVMDKVILSMWIWSTVTKKSLKDLSEFERNITKISWQKPIVVKSRKSVSNFKLREWMPVMLKTTLRSKKAVDFLKRLTNVVLPRIRDFSWISAKSFDSHWNYNLWLKSYALFPEFGLDDVAMPMGLQITLVFRSNSIKDSKLLMEQYWFVFSS